MPHRVYTSHRHLSHGLPRHLPPDTGPRAGSPVHGSPGAAAYEGADRGETQRTDTTVRLHTATWDEDDRVTEGFMTSLDDRSEVLPRG